MSPRATEPIDLTTAIHLLQVARGVLQKIPKSVPLPPDAVRALSTFYQLADYHGIAPADAPHIPDDGTI